MHASGIYLQLLPDWAPSKQPRYGRFDVLVKVAAGAEVADVSAMQLRLLDGAGTVVQVPPGACDPTPIQLRGPAWRRVSGRLVWVDEMVTQAEAALPGARSVPVHRRDAEQALSLVPVTCQVGVAGEPDLWWRFCNRSAKPMRVKQILQATILHLDGRVTRPASPYNGPSLLPPGRSLSGLWSLDVIEPPVGPGQYRLQLEVLGQRSAEIEYRRGAETG